MVCHVTHHAPLHPPLLMMYIFPMWWVFDIMYKFLKWNLYSKLWVIREMFIIFILLTIPFQLFKIRNLTHMFWKIYCTHFICPIMFSYNIHNEKFILLNPFFPSENNLNILKFWTIKIRKRLSWTLSRSLDHLLCGCRASENY